MKTILGAIAFVGVLIAGLTLLGAASGDPQSIAELVSRIDSLEGTVAQLEARVKKLESPGGGVTRPRTKASPKWQDKASWRRLQKGMSKEDVRTILGEPGKIDTTLFFMEKWYYPSISGGRVIFDEKGIVKGWSEP